MKGVLHEHLNDAIVPPLPEGKVGESLPADTQMVRPTSVLFTADT